MGGYNRSVGMRGRGDNGVGLVLIGCECDLRALDNECNGTWPSRPRLCVHVLMSARVLFDRSPTLIPCCHPTIWRIPVATDLAQ